MHERIIPEIVNQIEKRNVELDFQLMQAKRQKATVDMAVLGTMSSGIWKAFAGEADHRDRGEAAHVAVIE
jgi:hypothetical protein